MALRGVKVIEFAGLAPAPFCGMVLKDHGASVTRIDRPDTLHPDALNRGKRSIGLDLKKPQSRNLLTRLCSKADVLIEPFRPGIMEKYQLGPEDLCKANPKLIYARLTGFGQNGPFSKMAGHDINYIAVSGVLSSLMKADRPQPPINLLADFGGGGLICALGICLALLERISSGRGQIIDSNMVEGSAYLSSFLWTSRDENYQFPLWANDPGKNLLDGGAPFYQTYKTKDNKYMAVGALEPQFYATLIKGLGLKEDEYSQHCDMEETEKKFAEIFLSKTQAEWCKIFDYTDACVTPIVPLENAHKYEHNSAKKSFLSTGGIPVPIPAPRLSRSPGFVHQKIPVPGQHTKEILLEEGFKEDEIESLMNEKVIYVSPVKSAL